MQTVDDEKRYHESEDEDWGNLRFWARKCGLGDIDLVRPIDGVNLCLTKYDDRHIDLIRRAWALLKDTVKSYLATEWEVGKLVVFANTWRFKHVNSALGQNDNRRGLLYYDADVVARMPDDVVLVLITHEWTHEYVSDEDKAQAINNSWHKQYESAAWECERGVDEDECAWSEPCSGEELLDFWLEVHLTNEWHLAQLHAAIPELEGEAVVKPEERQQLEIRKQLCLSQIATLEAAVAGWGM